jgi:hypothetical protein
LPGVRIIPAPRGDFAKFETVIKRLPEQLARARRTASCVIVDTAPVGEVSETLRIAPMCDQVVFVARPRHTDRRRLIVARDLLDRTDAPTAGLVLVGQDAGMRSGYYSYGYSTRPNGMMSDSSEDRIAARRRVPWRGADRERASAAPGPDGEERTLDGPAETDQEGVSAGRADASREPHSD